MESSDKDLPLMSNTDDILVSHYILDLVCSFDDKVITGKVTLFLKPTSNPSPTQYIDKGDAVVGIQHDERENLLLTTGCQMEIQTNSSETFFESSAKVKEKSNFDQNRKMFEKDIQKEEIPSNLLDRETSTENANNSDICPLPINISADNYLQDRNEPTSENTSVESVLENDLEVIEIKTIRENVTVKHIEHNIKDLPSNKENVTLKEPILTPEVAENKDLFRVILDCCDIDIISVQEITISSQIRDGLEQLKIRREGIILMRELLGKPLKFSVNTWSLQIWKENIYSSNDFPQIICIVYSTRPNGASLTWSMDQDGRPCTFTQGAWINNRSLFPCQEPPVAMATWQANVLVPSDARVAMSGDNSGQIIEEGVNGKISFYFYTTMHLPMSTLAIAIGFWDCVEIVAPSTIIQSPNNSFLDGESSINLIPCTVIAPPSLISKARDEVFDYIPQCLDAAYRLLGAHPFPRLDLLILPRCFGSLGLANPNLIFLSQTLLALDGSMCIRLAHEISHFWFGLLIGARDWTEEWLSEGFATYVEDIIHSLTLKWSDVEQKEHAEIRAYLRYRTLVAELENTEEHLQTLRPTGGKVVTDKTHSVVYVKNGLNPEKAFTQVHYLKGYFLLRYLANLVGQNNFEQLLAKYVDCYRGQLVHSQAIFSAYFEAFPHVKSKHGIDMETLYQDWLDCSGMPQPLCNYLPSFDNKLYLEVLQQLGIWKHVNENSLKTKKKKRRKVTPDRLKLLETDQLVLLLELLLDEENVSHYTLSLLKDYYQLEKKNADILHRWCELVIKFNYKPASGDIHSFLVDHQAMGVYLYGELILSGHKWQRKLAEECFEALSSEMDSNTLVTVKEMVYGQ